MRIFVHPTLARHVSPGRGSREVQEIHASTMRWLISWVATVMFTTCISPQQARAAEMTTQDRVIVSGASGQLGGLAVRALLARGVPAKNLILVSRTPEALAQYAKLGASTRFGDFSKPESLKSAYAGGTRMLLISIGGGAGPRVEAQKRAIDAAIAAGVKQIAYTSWVAISRGERSGIAADHYQTEEILRRSGVAWTFLRNSIYSEALLAQAAKMVADGSAKVPAHEIRVGYVTREDCAAAAAAVLSPGHENKIYDITGPELIGIREIAAAASEATGKEIKVSAAEEGSGEPRGFIGPALEVTSRSVEELTGRPATSVRAFLSANRSKLLAGDARPAR
jgi:NAD(P)H dehydrogenase (quinone)